MTPYKGYLIDTYSVIVETPSGYAGVPSIKTNVWKTRIIEASTGKISVFDDETLARLAIDLVTDPTGNEKKRQGLINQIKYAEAEIADQLDLLAEENEKLERNRFWLAEKKADLAALEASDVKKSE